MSNEPVVKVTARIPQGKYKALRKKLIDTGKNFREWLEEAIEFYLQEVE